jgi:hypothetical protein
MRRTGAGTLALLTGFEPPAHSSDGCRSIAVASAAFLADDPRDDASH